MKKIVLILSCLSLALGCAVKKKPKISSDIILEQANNHMTDAEHKEAETSYKRLLEEYPDSKLRNKAQIGLADALYYQDKFEDAVFQYQKYIDIYPASDEIVKARFYKGMSYFNDRRTIDRDQTNITNAIEEFDEITTNFKDSKYFKKADENFNFGKTLLSENLLYIGKFYFRIGAYHSAISRFLDIMQIFPDKPAAREARFYLGKSYYKRENFKLAKKQYNKLIELFPESKFSKKAKKIISSKLN